MPKLSKYIALIAGVLSIVGILFGAVKFIAKDAAAQEVSPIKIQAATTLQKLDDVLLRLDRIENKIDGIKK
jgi:hypothetical protein